MCLSVSKESAGWFCFTFYPAGLKLRFHFKTPTLSPTDLSIALVVVDVVTCLLVVVVVLLLVLLEFHFLFSTTYIIKKESCALLPF